MCKKVSKSVNKCKKVSCSKVFEGVRECSKVLEGVRRCAARRLAVVGRLIGLIWVIRKF